MGRLKGKAARRSGQGGGGQQLRGERGQGERTASRHNAYPVVGSVPSPAVDAAKQSIGSPAGQANPSAVISHSTHLADRGTGVSSPADRYRRVVGKNVSTWQMTARHTLRAMRASSALRSCHVDPHPSCAALDAVARGPRLSRTQLTFFPTVARPRPLLPPRGNPIARTRRSAHSAINTPPGRRGFIAMRLPAGRAVHTSVELAARTAPYVY